MNKENYKVLTNIIGAVESGGQIYGKRNYAAYSAPYANSPDEHTITLGWGQNYGSNAKRLIQMIHDKDPALFKKIDSAGIEGMLLKDWVALKWNPTASQKEVLIKLITSDVGKSCQDELFEQQAAVYVEECEKAYSSDPKIVVMYCEIRHLGGVGPAQRIFNRIAKPITLKKIMNSLKKDQSDLSNDNQVGDSRYWSRHEKCKEFAEKYIVEEKASETSKTEKAIAQMENWAKDDTHGYDQIFRWGEKGDYDCSSSIIQAWENAGVPVKTDGASYTGNMKQVFLRNGFKDVTKSVDVATGAGLKRGDVLLNIVHHTAMYCGDGKEVEASINEKGTATGGQPGDQTGREFLIRSYRNYPWDCVLRYTEETSSESETKSGTSKSGGLNVDPKWVGRVTASLLNVRSWAGTEYPNIKSYPFLAANNLVDVCDVVKDVRGADWYYVRIRGVYYGFVSSSYIVRN